MKNSGQKRKGLFIRGTTTFEAKNDSRQWRAPGRFDEITGQVFTERTARVMNSSDQYWTRKTRLVYGRNEREGLKEEEAARLRENQRLKRNGHYTYSSQSRVRVGTRSLQSIALESVVQNVTDLTSDSCVYLPSILVKRIWDVVRKRYYVTFDTWALFSRLLHNEADVSDDLLRFAESFPTPKLQFATYINPLISNKFDFITCLCITTPFPVPDLIKISKIRNLGTLEIINTDTSSAGFARMGVSDRVMRGWYLAAKNEGAFPILRVLRLWNHEDLTTKSLAFLNDFPSLAVFDVRGCRFDPKEKVTAVNLGWKLNIETNMLKFLEQTCSKRTEYVRRQIGTNQGQLNFTKDGTKRIPRDELATFLVNHQASLESQQGTKKSKNVMERVMKMNVYGIRKHQDLDDWEDATYQTYARIGELRNDTDLQRVGVPVSDVVICGHELLSPKPVVMLRLGQSTEKMLVSTTKTSINAVSFIRVKAPSAEDGWAQSVAKGSDQQTGVANADGSRKDVIARSSTRRQSVTNADPSRRDVAASISNWREKVANPALRQREFASKTSTYQLEIEPNISTSQKEFEPSSSSNKRKFEPNSEEEEVVGRQKKQSSLRTLSIAKTQTSVQRGKKKSLRDMLGSFL